MAHMLAKLKGVLFHDIDLILKADAVRHAKEGLFLEHLWQNDENPNEVLFLFRVEDLDQARNFIKRVHGEALKENPYANLPQITYLK